MDVKPVRLFGRSVSAQEATELLILHQTAFSQSACKKCPGVCCKDCASSEGYLYKDDRSYAEVQALKRQYGWNTKSGFTSATGCKLPLHLRSTTCAAFYCENLEGGNSFSRQVLYERRLATADTDMSDVNVQEVSQRVNKLHEKMRSLFDRD